ncbi:MAG: hypothetical protein AB7D33_15200 [Sphingobium sp.]
MNDRIRVAVWGIGGVGGACLKEILRHDAFDLVAVLVHSEDKAGRDAGTLVGLPETGVSAIRDIDALIATKPDCVLYTPKDGGDFASDRELAHLLRSGIDVITSLPYHYLGNRPAEAINLLQDACNEGGTTLFATGINPGLMFERLALTALGASNAVTRVSVEEFVRIGTEPDHTLRAFGFGIPLEQSRGNDAVRLIAEQYFGQSIHIVGHMLGYPVSSLRHEGEWRVAAKPVQTPNMRIEAGEVEYISHRWFVPAGDGPEISFQCNWYLSDDQRPDHVPCEDYYIITIEGRPSLRLKVELRASIRDYVRLYADDPTVPVYYATAVPMIQAIGATLASPPGIRGTRPPANSHWRKDLRDNPEPLPAMI